MHVIIKGSIDIVWGRRLVEKLRNFLEICPIVCSADGVCERRGERNRGQAGWKKEKDQSTIMHTAYMNWDIHACEDMQGREGWRARKALREGESGRDRGCGGRNGERGRDRLGGIKACRAPSLPTWLLSHTWTFDLNQPLNVARWLTELVKNSSRSSCAMRIRLLKLRIDNSPPSNGKTSPSSDKWEYTCSSKKSVRCYTLWIWSRRGGKRHKTRRLNVYICHKVDSTMEKIRYLDLCNNSTNVKKETGVWDKKFFAWLRASTDIKRIFKLSATMVQLAPRVTFSLILRRSVIRKKLDWLPGHGIDLWIDAIRCKMCSKHLFPLFRGHLKSSTWRQGFFTVVFIWYQAYWRRERDGDGKGRGEGEVGGGGEGDNECVCVSVCEYVCASEFVTSISVL